MRKCNLKIKKFLAILGIATLTSLSVTPTSILAATPTVTDTTLTLSNYFTKLTPRVNSLYGMPATSSVNATTVFGTKHAISDVTFNVTVSRGSAPFYLTVVSPNGQKIAKLIGASGVVKFPEFINNNKANGIWYITVQTTGTVSTVSTSMRVDYKYK